MSCSSARNENSAKLQAPGISPPAGLRDPAGKGSLVMKGVISKPVRHDILHVRVMQSLFFV